MPVRMLSSGLLATSAGTCSFSVSASWYTDIRMLPSFACLRYKVSASQITHWFVMESRRLVPLLLKPSSDKQDKCQAHLSCSSAQSSP